MVGGKPAWCLWWWSVFGRVVGGKPAWCFRWWWVNGYVVKVVGNGRVCC